MMVDMKKREEAKTPAYEKLAITLPRELAQAVRREAATHHASSLSAYFAEEMTEALEKDHLKEILDEMDAKYGPPSPEAVTWSKEVLFGE